MTIPQVSGYGNYSYPYQTYSPPQFNIGNNNGYSSPTFRGAESRPPVMQQPLSRDTVELSVEKEIKTKKKEGLSTGAKWLIGIAGTALATYGCVVGHRMLNKPSIEKVAKNFSEIFRRDVSKEEALKLTERYKEIFKIKDDKNFRDAIFKQLKQDYGLGKTSYGYSIEKLEKGNLGYFNPFGKLSFGKNGNCTTFSFDDKGCIVVDSIRAKSREGFFQTIVHELNHAKQFEVAYKTNADEALNSYFHKMQNGEMTFISEMKNKGYDLINELKRPLKEFMGETKPNSLLKGSKEYDLGLKYIENQRNYIKANIDPNGYVKQLVEAESFGVEKLMGQTHDLFMSPWRIF